MALLAAISISASAQIQEPEAPQLEFALQLKVTLGEAYGIDNTQHGRRTVIPITGGTFEGKGLKGTIVNGGADYQLNAEGRTDSKYGWLNNSLFVCAPSFSSDFKGIVLNVWRIK